MGDFARSPAKNHRRLIILTPISCYTLDWGHPGLERTPLPSIMCLQPLMTSLECNSSSESTTVTLEANWLCSNGFSIIASGFWSILARNTRKATVKTSVFFFFPFLIKVLWFILQYQRLCDVRSSFMWKHWLDGAWRKWWPRLPCVHCTQELGTWDWISEYLKKRVNMCWSFVSSWPFLFSFFFLDSFKPFWCIRLLASLWGYTSNARQRVFCILSRLIVSVAILLFERQREMI